MTPSSRPHRLCAPRFAIIGAGFAGLTAAFRLKNAGAEVTVFERSDGIGGVWRANDYPGAACDVPSFLYSWSFAQKSDWSQRFATQSEILDYIESTVDGFNMRNHIRLNSDVISLEWRDSGATWLLTFRSGKTFVADFVVAALGQMSSPAIPHFAGIEAFAGQAFHTAAWRHDVDLSGKRVVVVGTGASAVQVVPAIAPTAASLAVVQRSPGYVLRKGNPEFRSPQSWLGARTRRALSYWSKELDTPRLVRWPKLAGPAEVAYRRDLRTWVADEGLFAKVEPSDRYGCKRILVSNDWFDTLQRPNVQVHDGGVDRVEADAVVLKDGSRLPADVIVYSTGFHANRFLQGIEVRGRGGQLIDEAWRRSPSAYLGMVVPDVPNLFLLYGPNTNPAWNSVLVMLECQVRYLTSVARRWQKHGPFHMYVRPSVAKRFARQLAARSARSIWVTGCRNWFLTAEGTNSQNWPALVSEYWWRTKRVRWSDYQLNDRCDEAEAS